MNNKIKRKIYIVLFTLLGILIGILFHGIVEIWYIEGLTQDFENFSLGFSWQQWFTIHSYFAIFTFVAGAFLGLKQGVYWWKVVYMQKRLDPFFNKLKRLLR